MRILLVSPPDHPIIPETRYLGIEKEVWLYARELVKEHDVTVMGNSKSIYPEGVKLLGITPQQDNLNELRLFQSYQYTLYGFDIIHDWSHLHLASRFNVNLPSLNIFFHAPALARYPKSPYNIIALSEWASLEFRRFYKQEAKYQYSIGIDTSLYKLSNQQRNERLLALGRAGPEKGNLEAMKLCQALGIGLDVISARGLGQGEDGSAPLTNYEKEMQTLADGNQIKLFPDSVPEAEKIKYMQICKALLYVTDHPEVTSHKIQEAMLCGAKIIAPNLGAMPEIVSHGVNGYLCRGYSEYALAIANIDKLSPLSKYDEIKEKFAIENVVKNYIPLYISVANGERW